MRAIIMVSALAVSMAAGAQPVDPLPVKPDTTVDGAVVGFTLGALPWLTMTAVDWQSQGRPSGRRVFGQLAVTLGSGLAGALIGASVDRAKIAVHDPVWDGALKGALAGTVSYMVPNVIPWRRDRQNRHGPGGLPAALIASGGAGALVGALVDARFTASVQPLPGGASLSVSW